MDFSLRGEAFVDWLKPILIEAHRVASNAVLCVINGTTKDFKYSGVPEMIIGDLIRLGLPLRKSQLFCRYGICGKTDYLKDNYEFIITIGKGVPLSYSCVEDISDPPKYKAGGSMSNRKKDGTRVDKKPFKQPKFANCGNVHFGSVGKNHMGHPIAHKNEAPFPLWLAERLITCFCPPEGIVADIMCGSSCTGQACQNLDRRYIGVDIRPSQIALSQERLSA